MIYRPDIKPPMWGPLSAVQYAVRHNAERLGIDPANLCRIVAFFEGAGQPKDIISGLGLTGGAGNTWPRNVYRINGDNNEIFFDEPTPVASELSVLAGFERITNNTSNDVGLYDDKRVSQYSTSAGVVCIIRRVGASGGLTFGVGTELTYNISSDLTPVGSYSDLAYVWKASARQEIWQNGAEINYNVNNIAPSYTVSPNVGMIGTYYDAIATRTMNDNVHYVYLVKQALTPSQIAQLHETPYALLMPVSRPFIFDMAGGGGTLVTALADLRGTIRNNIQRSADLRAAISTPQSAQADVLSKISRALTQTADSRAVLSNLRAAVSDSKTAISNSSFMRKQPPLWGWGSSRSRKPDRQTDRLPSNICLPGGCAAMPAT